MLCASWRSFPDSSLWISNSFQIVTSPARLFETAFIWPLCVQITTWAPSVFLYCVIDATHSDDICLGVAWSLLSKEKDGKENYFSAPNVHKDEYEAHSTDFTVVSDFTRNSLISRQMIIEPELNEWFKSRALNLFFPKCILWAFIVLYNWQLLPLALL